MKPMGLQTQSYFRLETLPQLAVSYRLFGLHLSFGTIPPVPATATRVPRVYLAYTSRAPRESPDLAENSVTNLRMIIILSPL